MHPELIQHGGRDEVVWFACRFSCSEDMRLALVLGYDGPLKVWVDGQARFHDPNGINPAIADKVKVSIRAAQGTHEVLLALGTNHGAAWGIFLRFERIDVPKAQRLKSREQIVMPNVLG